MKTYELEFDVDALKEWHKLDGSIRAQFKKQIVKRLQVPHVPSAKLHGDLQNTYKIKLRDLGYRLVYEVIDLRLVIVVIAVGRRDHNEVFAGVNVTAEDARFDYGEPRFTTAGVLDGRMVVLVWTPRGEVRRIISMRKANERESSKFAQAMD